METDTQQGLRASEPTGLGQTEAEVARTAHLVLAAAALVERMRVAPRSPSLGGNLHRLERAVAQGQQRLVALAAPSEGQQRGPV